MGVLVREVINFSSFWKSSVVLLDGRADDLPARVRLRLRLARLDGRRLRLRRVRRHRHGRHRGAVLVRLLGDVRLVRQVPVPAHLRRDPRRAGRHRGARHRRGAVDRRARRRLRLRAAAGRDGVRARPELGHAARPVHRHAHRLRLGVLRDHHRRDAQLDRPLLLRHEHGRHADVPDRRHVLPDLRPARVGAGARPVQPALPLRGARPRRGRSGSTAGSTSTTWASCSCSRS